MSAMPTCDANGCRMMAALLTRGVCAQVLAVGFLALVEVLLKDPAEGRRA